MNLTVLEAAAPSGGGMSTLIMMGGIILVMYFTMLRPQNKKRKALQSYRENIEKGDKIVTIGGIHGKVAEIKDHTVLISTEGGGKLLVEKSAVSMDASTQMNEETVKQAT